MPRTDATRARAPRKRAYAARDFDHDARQNDWRQIVNTLNATGASEGFYAGGPNGYGVKHRRWRFDPLAPRLAESDPDDPHDADTFATWLDALPEWAQWVVACAAAELAVHAAALVGDDYRVAMAAINAPVRTGPESHEAWSLARAPIGRCLALWSASRAGGIGGCVAADLEMACYDAVRIKGLSYAAIARRARAVLAFRVADTEVER